MSYRLRIGIGDTDGTETNGGKRKAETYPGKDHRFLFGAPGTVLVLNPTQAIRTVEVHELDKENA